jgi:hypothetical protein
MRIRKENPKSQIRNPNFASPLADFGFRISDFGFRIFPLSLLTGQLGQVNLLELTANLIRTLFADRFQLAVEGTIRRESAFAILSRGLMAKECPPRLFLNHASAGRRKADSASRSFDGDRACPGAERERAD